MSSRQLATVFAWTITADYPFLVFVGWLGAIPVFELAPLPPKSA